MSTELRKLIREVAADHPESSPQELATWVAKLTPEDSLVDFYTATLVDYVRQVIGGDCRNSLDNALGRNSNGGNKSPKLNDRRQHFARLMLERVKAGAGWKTVGDCTVEDLRACIAERIQSIERTQHQIRNFEELIDLMKQHKVRVAKDLLGAMK